MQKEKRQMKPLEIASGVFMADVGAIGAGLHSPNLDLAVLAGVSAPWRPLVKLFPHQKYNCK